MSYAAAIQARLGSKRLPRKVLLDIGGRMMLEQICSQLDASAKIQYKVISTTLSSEDDALEEFARAHSLPVSRVRAPNFKKILS